MQLHDPRSIRNLTGAPIKITPNTAQQLVLHLEDREFRGPRTHVASILNNTDSIGIAVTMHGYIDVQYADKAVFKNSIDEDKAVVDLAALFASRFPAAVIILPENAASLSRP